MFQVIKTGSVSEKVSETVANFAEQLYYEFRRYAHNHQYYDLNEIQNTIRKLSVPFSFSDLGFYALKIDGDIFTFTVFVYLNGERRNIHLKFNLVQDFFTLQVHNPESES